MRQSALAASKIKGPSTKSKSMANIGSHPTGRVVMPRPVRWKVMCHQWLRRGVEASLMLPTIWWKDAGSPYWPPTPPAVWMETDPRVQLRMQLPSTRQAALPVIPHLLMRTRPGVVAWRGMACCVALVEQVSATVAPSLSAHDPMVPARAGRAGDGAAEPGQDPGGIARSHSPRTSPRRARNSERPDARK